MCGGLATVNVSGVGRSGVGWLVARMPRTQGEVCGRRGVGRKHSYAKG